MQLFKSFNHPNSQSDRRVKVETSLQYEAVECGAASLRSILRYYGKTIPLSDLRRECGITRDGSNALKVIQAARRYQLVCEPFKNSFEDLKKEGRYPCILFWGFAHFLVLEGFDSEYAYLSDPAQGRIRISHQEFKDDYTGVGVNMYPTSLFEKGGKEDYPLMSLPTFLSSFWKYIFLVVFVSTVSIIPTLAIAGASAQFINKFLQNKELYFGIPIVWVFVISTLILLSLLIFQFLLIRRLEFVISKKLTGELYQKLFSVPYNFYQQRMLGELASRMKLGFDLSNVLVSQIIRFTSSLWQSLLLIFVSSFISIQLAFLTFIVIAANIFINILLTEKRKDANRLLSMEEGKMLGISLQGITDIETLKASGVEFDFLKHWQRYFSNVVEKRQVLGLQIALSTVSAQGSSFLVNALVIGFGGILIIDGSLTLGGLVSYQFLLAVIITPLTQISSIGKQFQTLDGLLGRLLDLRKSENDPYVRSMLPDQTSSQINSSNLVELSNYDLVLDGLTFGFNQIDPPFINDLNLNIPYGSHIALVGGSGSGKSTLIKILAGLHKPSAGSLHIDGKNIDQIVDIVFRSSLAYVPQDVFMFNETISTNLSLWRDYFTDSDLLEAAKISLIDDLILSHPDGLNRLLSTGGSDISGGQRQRLEIARALLVKPKILLLDEATSALDNETETILLDNIWSLGITTISVAHRMASALKGDYVLLLENGVVLERGSPNELLNTNSRFKQLVDFETHA